MQVYVVIADTDGRVECLGVFKDKTDAMNLCVRKAEAYAAFYPGDNIRVYYGKDGTFAETFSWTISEKYIQ